MRAKMLAKILVGVIIYLLVGLILRNHTSLGKKYFGDYNTRFVLLWGLPFVASLIVIAAIVVIFFIFLILFATIVLLTFAPFEKSGWHNVLADLLDTFLRKRSP